MVEGPGATRNGRKAQVLIGKVVSSSAPLYNPCHAPLVGCTLIEAFSVGKEMFLIFNDDTEEDASSSDTAMRLHFGMNGSFRTRKVANLEQQPPPSSTPHWKQNDLRLYFEDGNNPGNYTVAEAWDTTVNYPVSASSARDKFTNSSSRDVCSVLFNAQNVFTSLRQSGSRLIISDALLNQEIFPGVGNIIKIESLHRSKIDPRRMVNSITDIELRRLIRYARQYSMDWLQTGRAGTKLVYNQTVCGTCKGMTIKMQKIGGSSAADGNSSSNSMSRVTFWCTSCQPFDPTSQGNSSGTISSSTAGSQGTILGRNPAVTNRTQPQCPQHGLRATKLSRVRKEGDNTLRIFFTCKMKSCQYFHWADGPFPSCPCGKKAVLRISKTEKSGGRWFLCCAGGSRGNNSNGCGHFTWATDDHLAPLSTLLTPLL